MKIEEQIRNFLGKIPSLKKKLEPLSLDFKSNPELSVGVEVELQIVNRNILDLADRSDEMIEKLKPQNKQFVPELFKAIIEINSTPHKNIRELETEMGGLISLARGAADGLDCDLMGSGCHPFTHYANLGMRDHARYGLLLERNQWLARRWMVSGMHIHMGMRSANSCIRFMHYFEHFIPHFIALSASSPYWQGEDTGLDSCRSIISESMSTAALLYSVASWADLTELVQKLERSKTITSLKDLHWDIRPSPAYGTLELRVCDMPTNSLDVCAIAAFAHTLALWFADNADWLSHMPKPSLWMARENKWRAMRYGMDAEIIKSESGRTEPMREDFAKILERVADTARTHGYEAYMAHIRSIIEKGNGASRQRAIIKSGGSLQDVVRHNALELKEGKPVYS